MVELLFVALFVGGAAICTALLLPSIWSVVNEHVLRPKVTYQQCTSLKEGTDRLACYDDVARQTSRRRGPATQR